MAFLDKLFRWKKKPFKSDSDKEQTDKVEPHSSGKEVPKKTADWTPVGSGKSAHIIIRPHISEKSSQLAVFGQYVFEVAPQATKSEVKLALKDLYGIVPQEVKVMNVLGKRIRFGRTFGATRVWKKAIVKLPEGKTIDVYKK